MSTVVFHSCPAAVSHYIATVTKWLLRSIKWPLRRVLSYLFFFCSKRRSFFCPIVTHASRVKYWHKKLTLIEGSNHYTNFAYHLAVPFTVKGWLVLTHVGYIRFCLHSTIHTVSGHSSAFLSIKWIYENAILFAQIYAIVKKSIPIHIETLARGFTEDKTVIFLGWRHNIMTFVETITNLSRDNGRLASEASDLRNRRVAKRVYLV